MKTNLGTFGSRGRDSLWGEEEEATGQFCNIPFGRRPTQPSGDSGRAQARRRRLACHPVLT